MSLLPQLSERHATWLELFFDLVYVVTIAILTELLRENIGLSSLTTFFLFFIPIWWSWVGHTLYYTRFDQNDLFQKAMTFVQMLAALSMAIHLEGIHKDSSHLIGFVLSYAVTRLSLVILYLRLLFQKRELKAFSLIMSLGFSLGIACWILSIFFPHPVDYILWFIGITIDLLTIYISKRVAVHVPINVIHLPERFGLFTIIVLGESILSVITGIRHIEWGLSSFSTVLPAFILTVSIWWNYFDYVDKAPLQCTLGNGKTYVFLHLPLVSGMILCFVGLQHMISWSHTEMAYKLISAGISVWLISFSLIQCVTYPKGDRPFLLKLYLGLSLLILLIGFVLGSYLYPVVYLSLITGISLIIGILDSKRRSAMPNKAYGDSKGQSHEDNIKEYRGKGFVVAFDKNKCTHSGVCLHGLPGVFNLKARPWVQTDNGEAKKIKDVVEKCPSRALQFKNAPISE